MATGQTLLNLMELVDQELQLQAGETDVVRGLLALNAAQDYFESLLAMVPNTFGSGTGTVTTAKSTETTAFPTTLLRLDRLQFIDPDTSRPSGPDLENIAFTGGHVGGLGYLPDLFSAGSGNGPPRGYYTNGTSIYWSPLPDAVHTLRWYGLATASDITAAGTFVYPTYAMLPLATFAAKIYQVGVADPTDSYDALAQTLFQPVLMTMKSFNRDRAAGYDYKFVHSE